MRSCYCPNCGNSQYFNESKNDFIYCQYCGTKIDLMDNRKLYKYVDEAQLKRADTEQMVQLKKLEMEEKEREHRSDVKALVAGAALIVLLISGFIAYNTNSEEALAIATCGGLTLFLLFIDLLIPFSRNNQNEEEK